MREGKLLFQVLLTGSRALNILFYYSIKSKNYQVKYTDSERGGGGGEAIIRGRQLIKGWLLFEEIQYLKSIKKLH